MPKVVDLRVDVDTEDWHPGGTWIAGGVLAGFVTLRLRGQAVIAYRPFGLNNSAIALARSVCLDHEAATDATALLAQWPMFFCAARLRNRCGVIADFSVRRRGPNVELSEFYGCALPAGAHIVVPWTSWARAALGFAASVYRRCPRIKQGMPQRFAGQYQRGRVDLLAAIGAARRAQARRAV